MTELYCLLALDLDGTLLNEHGRVSQRNREAVHRVAETGAIIALCSGRSTACMREPIRMLGLDVHIVSFNGAHVYCLPSNPAVEHVKPSFQYSLSTQQISSLIEFGNRHCRTLQFYLNGKVIVQQSRRQEDEALIEKYREMSGAEYEFVSDLYTIGQHPSPKILVLGTDIEDVLLPQMKKYFEGTPINLVQGAFFVEVLPQGVHKGAGLEQLCKHIGVPLSKVVSFGDGNNDEQFLRMSGLGLAMRNGVKRAHDAANRVTTYTNINNGVAQEIEEMLRRKEFSSMASVSMVKNE